MVVYFFYFIFYSIRVKRSCDASSFSFPFNVDSVVGLGEPAAEGIRWGEWREIGRGMQAGEEDRVHCPCLSLILFVTLLFQSSLRELHCPWHFLCFHQVDDHFAFLCLKHTVTACHWTNQTNIQYTHSHSLSTLNLCLPEIYLYTVIIKSTFTHTHQLPAHQKVFLNNVNVLLFSMFLTKSVFDSTNSYSRAGKAELGGEGGGLLLGVGQIQPSVLNGTISTSPAGHYKLSLLVKISQTECDKKTEKKNWLRLCPLTFHVHWSLLIFPGSVFTTFRKVLLPFTAADMSKPLRQKETRSQFLSSWIVTSHQLHRVTSGQITNSFAAVQNIRHQTNSQNLANSSGYNTVNSKCSQVNTVNNKNNLNIYISINYKWQM